MSDRYMYIMDALDGNTFCDGTTKGLTLRTMEQVKTNMLRHSAIRIELPEYVSLIPMIAIYPYGNAPRSETYARTAAEYRLIDLNPVIVRRHGLNTWKVDEERTKAWLNHEFDLLYLG